MRVGFLIRTHVQAAGSIPGPGKGSSHLVLLSHVNVDVSVSPFLPAVLSLKAMGKKKKKKVWACTQSTEEHRLHSVYHILISVHKGIYNLEGWETTHGLAKSISLYWIFWKSDSYISIVRSHFNICSSPLKFIEI